MKIFIVSVVLAAVSPSSVLSRELQMFDTALFGKATSEQVKLLLDKTRTDDIEPFVIWTDIRCGRYIAASVFYRKPVTMDDAREALDRLYGSAAIDDRSLDPDRVLWRVESRRFAIHLVDNGDEGVRILYLHFMPLREWFKGVMRAEGFEKAAEAMKDADCAEWEELLVPRKRE